MIRETTITKRLLSNVRLLFPFVILIGITLLMLSSIRQLANEGDGSTMEKTKFSTSSLSSSSAVQQQVRRPFKMPERGKAYEIFQPLYDMDESKKDVQLFASPKYFMKTIEDRISYADSLLSHYGKSKIQELKYMTLKEQVIFSYFEMIKSITTGTVFNKAEMSINALTTNPINFPIRKGGKDWAYLGDTMTGWKRMDNIRELLTNVIQNGIKGDYIETGVWRGGASVFARAVMNVLEPESTRISYVCDSFNGLPPGDKALDAEDKGWDKFVYLRVPSDVAANNFVKYGMLDANVVFAKGFFNETMPPLSKHIETLSVMRLDGDMYESTVDVLYHLYDKLSVGGFVIIDDWFGFPARTACEDFFKVHGINPEIIPIDELSAYWQKTEDVVIQYWRYEQSKFTDDAVN